MPKSLEPKLMTLSRMRTLIEPHSDKLRESVFFNSELAVIHGVSNVFQLIMQQNPPFSINDYRLGIITQGEFCVNINLVEKHIKAGSLVFIGPGTVIHPVDISPDLQAYGFGLSNDFPMPFAHDAMPNAFNGQVRDFQLSVGKDDIDTAFHIFETLWHVVRQPIYNRQLVSDLVAAQMHHYDALYHRHLAHLQKNQSREQTIFDRFIYLVNLYAVHQHQIGFYASHMCLTERYLGTTVRCASGITAKEWIDRALIMRAQVELRHTDRPVARISEDLSFPNPSFFCKFFHRMTGLTPQKFRMDG
ncbi:MAG TPA: hypothetical protein DCG33_00265 [Prevotellaceae bacterium]|jgi:AraC-like DNA-binding protein|nr:hypothetical protein [Prevotellaceae bacterium]